MVLLSAYRQPKQRSKLAATIAEAETTAPMRHLPMYEKWRASRAHRKFASKAGLVRISLFALIACVLMACLFLSSSDDHGGADMSMRRHLLSTGSGPIWEQCGYENGNKARAAGFIVLYLFLIFHLFVGVAILCDDFFVPALEAISQKLNLSEDVAGATFMAAGSSAPELFTSLAGIFVDSDVGVGTIVGSAVFNVFVIIALSGIFAGQVLKLDGKVLVRDTTFYGISIILFSVFSYDGYFELYEAITLLALYIVYLIVLAFNKRLMKAITFKSNKVSPMPSARSRSGKLATPPVSARASIQSDLTAAHLASKLNDTGSRKPSSTNPTTTLSPDTIPPRPRRSSGNTGTVIPAHSVDARAQQNDSRRSSSIAPSIASASHPFSTQTESGIYKRQEDLSVSDNMDLFQRGGPSMSSLDDAAHGFVHTTQGRLSTTISGRRASTLSQFFSQSQAASPRASQQSFGLPTDSRIRVHDEAAKEGPDGNIGAPYQLSSPPSQISGLHVPIVVSSQAIVTAQPKVPRATAVTIIDTDDSSQDSSGVVGGLDQDADDLVACAPISERICNPCQADLRPQLTRRDDGTTSFGQRLLLVWRWVLYLIALPYMWLFVNTIPPGKKHYVSAFILCVVWIMGLSFGLVTLVAKTGCIIDINDYVMGLVIVAAGTSIPDALSSILVAQDGYGDMAVSNAFGSNIFDIDLGIGLPFLIKILVTGSKIDLLSDADRLLLDTNIVSLSDHAKFGFILLGILILAVVVFIMSKFRLTRSVSVCFLALYGIFIGYAIFQELYCKEHEWYC